jgi:uncharacterized protein with HEPN domain
MRPETAKLLDDIYAEAVIIAEETAGESLGSYRENRRLRKAVERSFEIIGEAMRRLSQQDPETAKLITAHADIVAFRNVLIHGYDVLNQAKIWEVIQTSLPILTAEVESLLQEVEERTDRTEEA